MKDNTALYKQLIGSLKEEILNMKEGDKIPSERQLCEIYNISRTTVRNAINDLEHAGHLERIQGKGTFVSNKKNDQQNLSNYYSFTERTKEIGKVPRTVILEYHIRIPSEAVRERIGADEYDMYIEFTRLRLADNVPMLLETTYIKYDDFPTVTKMLLEEKPLYDIFEQEFNRKIVKVTESFSATILEHEQAKSLKTKTKSAGLKIKRSSFDKDGKIIEFTVSYAPEDKFNYETTYFPG